jgi:hypothetical protein
MKPCTTYTYQMQRVPYTTYRPVYRQETYQVPVTTLVNNCQSGTCGPAACDTCGTGAVSGAPNFTPQQPNYAAPVYAPSATGASPADTVPSLTPTPAGSAMRVPIPSGTLSTEGSYDVQSAYQVTPSYSTPAYAAPVASPDRTLQHTARIPDVNTATQGVRPQSNQRPFLDRLQDQGSQRNFERQTKQAKLAPLQKKTIAPQTRMTSLHRRWSYSPVRLASSRSDVAAGSTFSSVDAREKINSAWDDVK